MVSLSVILFTLLLNSRLLISAETVVTCDGFVQRLSCDSGVIRVQSATFGRTNSNICSVGRPQGQTSNTLCLVDVHEVSKRCDGLSMCELNTQGLAEHDPCEGTYKYYTTNYTCIQAETSVTCHGGYAYLSCENGQIQINTANYGRTDKVTCSERRPSNELQNSSCFSPNALAPVSKSCNGLESCELFATQTVFTDPCVGTYKYLAVSYFCLPSALCTSVICEHANDTLKCEQGAVIHIHTANYGRTDRSTCSVRRRPFQTTKTDCYSSNSMEIVTNGCEGNNSCVLVASNGVFSDPCFGTFKYLYVSYSCVAKCKCYCVWSRFYFLKFIYFFGTTLIIGLFKTLLYQTKLIALIMVAFFVSLQNSASEIVDFGCFKSDFKVSSLQ